jgi:hypothetical protein
MHFEPAAAVAEAPADETPQQRRARLRDEADAKLQARLAEEQRVCGGF